MNIIYFLIGLFITTLIIYYGNNLFIVILNNSIVYTFTVFITAISLKFLLYLFNLWLPLSLAIILTTLIITILSLIRNQLFHVTGSLFIGFVLLFTINFIFLFDVNVNDMYLLDSTNVVLMEYYNYNNFSEQNNGLYDRILSPGPEPQLESLNKTKYLDARQMEQDTEDAALKKDLIFQERKELTDRAIVTMYGALGTGDPVAGANVIVRKVIKETLGRYGRSPSPQPEESSSSVSNSNNNNNDSNTKLLLLLGFFSRINLSFLVMHNLLSFIVYGFIGIILIFIYFNVFSLYSIFKAYFSTRIPIGLVSDNEQLFLVNYNIIIILFSFFVLIYFIIGLVYIITYLLKYNNLINILFKPVNGNYSELILYNFIKYNLILILIFSLVLYYYFELSVTFAVWATISYKQIFNDSVHISYYWGNSFIDYYIYYILFIAKLIFGYFWAGLAIKECNLTVLKLNLNKQKIIEIVNKKNMLVRILSITFILYYVQYIMGYISNKLFIEPFNSSTYVFTLGEIFITNNYAHIYLCFSILTIIFCYGLIKYLNNVLSNSIDSSYNLFGYIYVTKSELINIVKCLLLVTFSLSYYILFINTLWIFTHYIPAGYITITNAI